MKITHSVDGIIEEREATAEEEKALLAAQKEAREFADKEKSNKDAILNAKESARTKLAALGLTPEEISAIS